MKKIFAILTAVMLLLSCSACSSDESGEYPVTLANITVSEKPHSIICLSDSIADILIACGYSELITARSDECTQPELSSTHSVGAKDDPAVKNIIDSDPDVVFADKTISDDAYSKLTDSGITVIILMPAKDTTELTRLYENVCSVADGKKTGKQTGTEKSKAIIVTMSDLQRVVPESNIVTTACYLYDAQGNAATEKTLEGKLFGYTNAVNVCASSDTTASSMDKIKLSDPDFIFCDVGIKSELEKDKNLKNLKAVKNGNIFEIDKNEFQRQGNSLTENLSFMIEKMYPQLKNPNFTEPEASKVESSAEENSVTESSIEEASNTESSVEERSVEESSIEDSSADESSAEESSSQVSSDDSLVITDSLSYGYGESGDNITKIQQRLAYLGYFNDDATGYFGNVTVSAVTAFESANGLNVDGYLSTDDLRLMFSSDAKRSS